MAEKETGQKGRRVTSVDVAKEAGVSQSTVSRVFAPNSTIRPRQRERILEVAHKMGYFPNALARGLTMRRSGIIGIVASDMQESLYTRLFSGLVNGLQHHGMQMLIFNMKREEQLEDILSRLQQYQIDGMILTASGLTEEGVLKCSAMGKPIVMINRFVSAPNIKAVCCDSVGGGRRVADHLVACGRRQIALLVGPEDSYTSQDRARGFCERLRELGVPLCASVKADELTHAEGRRAMNRLLEQTRCFDAVFCTNDVLAVGALDALRRDHGIEVPGQMALAGFDGIMESEWPGYNFTTIAQPVDEMVRASIGVLQDMLEGKEVFPDCKSFEGELLVRASTQGGAAGPEC